MTNVPSLKMGKYIRGIDRVETIVYTIVGIGLCIVIATTLTVSCRSIFMDLTSVRDVAKENIHRNDSLYSTVQGTHISSVRMENGNTVTQLDSLKLKEILALQEHQIDELRTSHDIIVNDFRQEINNVINKLNGWMSFWIALITVLCGAMPIVIQYVTNRKANSKVESLMQRMNDELSRHKSTLNLNALLNSLNRSCISESDSKVCINKMFVYRMLNNIDLQVQSLLSADEKKDAIFDEDRCGIVSIILIQLYVMIEEYSISIDVRSLRECNNIKDRISLLLSDIAKGESKSLSNFLQEDLCPLILKIRMLVSNAVIS